MKQGATLDSSFWINAHRSGLLPYVFEKFELHFAPAVAAELVEGFPSGREFWHSVRQGRLSETAPRIERLREFGSGERAAINVALEHPDWVLLIDDRRPFNEAVRRGIKVMCTPVLIVELEAEGTIEASRGIELLWGLSALQTVSPDLLAPALAQLQTTMRAKERGE